MSPNPYSEEHLEEQPALALLAELGWTTGCGLEETFAPDGGSLGRRDRREVVLLPRLRAALERLNPGQPPEAIRAAIAGLPLQLVVLPQPHRPPQRLLLRLTAKRGPSPEAFRARCRRHLTLAQQLRHIELRQQCVDAELLHRQIRNRQVRITRHLLRRLGILGLIKRFRGCGVAQSSRKA